MSEVITVNQARRLCKQCGEPMIGQGKAEFCSTACRRIWARRPRWRNCNICGVLFYAEEGARRCEDCLAGRAPQPRRRPQIRPDDPFAEFLLAQRRAKAAGKNLSYGEWQKQKYAEGKK